MQRAFPVLSRRTLTALAAAAVLGAALQAPAFAAVVEGTKFDDTTKVAGRDLSLNGAGTRTRLMFKIYAIGIYLAKKETTVDGVLGGTGPRRINIVMLRDISTDDFGQAFMSGITANTDKAEKGKLVNQMVSFGDMFANIPSLKKGDVLHLDWVPDKGTTINLNGKPIVEPLPDQAFYNALLKIWLGEKPVEPALKPALLGA